MVVSVENCNKYPRGSTPQGILSSLEKTKAERLDGTKSTKADLSTRGGGYKQKTCRWSIQIGPPKGDRSAGFYRFLSRFIENTIFSLKTMHFYMEVGLEWLPMVSQYFWNQFWIYIIPQKSVLDLKTEFWISHPSKSLPWAHNSLFGSLISNPISQKLFLWTIRTILVFGKHGIW